MRVLLSVLSTTLFWCLVQTYPVKAATDEGDIICPDSNPLNCYPKLFAATNEWQVVRESQVIPAGLNVRLDLENMNREAKLGDASGKQALESEKKNHELVVSDGDAGFLSSLNFVKKWASTQFSNPPAFAEVVRHLDVLVDWASDRESGVIIAQNVQPLLKASGLYSSKKTKHNTFGLTEAQYLKVQEMTYRILSSSFRNNLEAQEKLLTFLNDPEVFLQQLAIGDESVPDIIVQRKLGLLGSLMNNHVFNDYIDRGNIEAELILLYMKVDSLAVRQRIMTILEDLRLEKRNVDADFDTADADSSDDGANLNKRFAFLTRNNLVGTSLASDPQSRRVLEGLGELKQLDRSAFKADNQFLDWMDKQINLERSHVNGLRKRETGHAEAKAEAEGRYLDRLIVLRHQVFGNPLGSRKEYLDEL